ncbi:MAG: hypothetical protein KAR06_12730 [Deltaproteobacteria bacterium]|nr:hypothetical protein [Deltaproteobacteria bacterium]
MSELLIITEKGRSTGFKLAGFETKELEIKDDPSELIKELKGYSLLCIDTNTLNRIDAMTLKRVKKEGLPIIIPLNIPSMWQEEKEEESPIVRMLRRAIGYQIKIKS